MKGCNRNGRKETKQRKNKKEKYLKPERCCHRESGSKGRVLPAGEQGQRQS